jgi:putative transposase
MPNLKYKYGNRKFWRNGSDDATVGRNRKAIAEHIKKEDIAADQMTSREFAAPFTGRQDK